MYWLGRIITLSVIAGSAVLIALLLGHVAHDDIGLTRPEIRHSALIATAVIAMLLVV
jgi:replication-associated recombination protein RarA